MIENSDKITGKVLDFGCGSMQYKTIMKFADEYIGLDIQGAEENGFFADDVIYYDGKHIPFEDASFDSVFAIEVFEHVEDIEYVLSEIHRILKKGGVFMFTVPMTFPLHLEPWDYRRFTKYGIKKYLKESGFKEHTIKGSTCEQDTLRRMKIMCWQQRHPKQGWFLSKYSMLYTVYSNILYVIRKEKADKSKLPIDFMVIAINM